MSTGYTSKIAKGITFKEFALICARGFGACASLRDEPFSKDIPEFKPSNYHTNKIITLENCLASIKQMTIEGGVEQARIERETKNKKNAEYRGGRKELRDKYITMLQAVIVWKPPTPDHQELKQFMQNQINESIKWDCSADYYKEDTSSLPTGEEWIEQKIESILEDISYHIKEEAKDRNRTDTNNKWVNDLKDSL